MNSTVGSGTNFENIPVSSMEGPSSPTSIIYWQRDNMCTPSSATVFRKKIIVERGSVNKNVSSRNKKRPRKCPYSEGHLENDKDKFVKHKSHLENDNSKQLCSPLVQLDGNRTMKQQGGSPKRAIAKYRMYSTSPLPARKNIKAEEKILITNSVISISSNELQPKLKDSAYNPSCKSDITDYSVNLPSESATSIYSELPSDDCNSFSPKIKKHCRTKDSAAQTTCSLIESVPQQTKNSCPPTLCDSSRKFKADATKQKQFLRYRQSRLKLSSQSPGNWQETMPTQVVSTKALKIPDHKVIYMDKVDVTTPLFWTALNSQFSKPEMRVSVHSNIKNQVNK